MARDLLLMGDLEKMVLNIYLKRKLKSILLDDHKILAHFLKKLVSSVEVSVVEIFYSNPLILSLRICYGVQCSQQGVLDI